MTASTSRATFSISVRLVPKTLIPTGVRMPVDNMSIRARIGIGKEELSPPPEVITVASLIDWLKGRGDGYATAFEDSTSLRVAVKSYSLRTSMCPSRVAP